MTRRIKVLIENLKVEPYASILCYPKISRVEMQKRIGELREHGVKAVEFAGETSAFNVPVLGKGFVGIVVIAHLNGQRAALKIRRVDADRVGLQHEAQMLAKANKVQVGPKLMGASKNFLLMQLVDGKLLHDWLKTYKEKEHICKVLNDILEQCWRLDRIGLDHGELSRAPKHLIVDRHQKPWIVDFETASIDRKPANVTSVCQFLFTSRGAVATEIAELLSERNREKVIHALRLYKKDKIRENFNRVLKVSLF